MQTERMVRRLMAAMTAFGTMGALSCHGAKEGPWEDRLHVENPVLGMRTRQCFDRPTIVAHGGAEAPAACPSQADLVKIGLFTPAPPNSMGGADLEEGPVEWNGGCCYLMSHWHTGRPFEVEGEARRPPTRRRSDWSIAAVDVPLDAATRAALADAWSDDGRAEHASIASFSRFSLELLALGAPANLVARTHQAALDEIEHARLCFGLASRYAGQPVGPGALEIGGAHPRTDLRAATLAAIREGCLAETEAALLAEAQLEGATDPAVRAALTRIAADEAEHAALAWAFVAWAIREDRSLAPEIKRALTTGIETAATPTNASPIAASLRAHGRLDVHEIAAIPARVRRDVVLPCARALLT